MDNPLIIPGSEQPPGKWISDLVPEGTLGRNANFILVKAFPSHEEARQSFKDARQRLLDIPRWQSMSGSRLCASFSLMSPQGKQYGSGTLPQEGDLIRLKLPGPNPFDWVRIETIKDTLSITSLHVRPCADPSNHMRKIAHHYKAKATNTFSLRVTHDEQDQWYCEAHINSRNKIPNGIRGFGAVLGAWLGLEALQWNAFLRGLMVKE